MPENAITVRQLNLYVKSLLESDPKLLCVRVTGEISNFKSHYASGHWYFTLKDADAAVRCVMFRSSAQRVGFDVKDGMQVTVTGRISLYEKDGQYQFYAENMSVSGEGDLAADFRRIKEKLEKEGLFDPATKRPLPKFPKCIAVITSPTGAAVQDMLNILSRRYPACDVVFCPVTVQGDQAVPEMIKALDDVYLLDGIDIIMIGRGGGSAEDLCAFNDEQLARKIYESPVLVISAVGHETDFTICDFVADVRASTPSAAAELAVPERTELAELTAALENRIKRSLENRYDMAKQRYLRAVSHPSFSRPLYAIDKRIQLTDALSERIFKAVNEKVAENENKLKDLMWQLDLLSPVKAMANGFTVTKKGEKTVRSVSQLDAGDEVSVNFADGKAYCTVKQTKRKV